MIHGIDTAALALRLTGTGYTGPLGIVEGQSMREYHGTVDAPAWGLSSSQIKEAEPTASHFIGSLEKKRLAKLAGKEDEAEHFLVGTLVHHAILTPDEPFPTLAVEPSTYTDEKGAAKKWTYQANACKAWREMQQRAGRILISETNLRVVESCVASILQDPKLRAMFADGRSEVAYYWRKTVGGVSMLLKARADFVPYGNCLVDIKTVAGKGGGDDEFQWEIAKRGYHQSAAHYIDGWSEIGELPNRPAWWEPKTNFVWVVVEKEPPFLATAYCCDALALEMGREANEKAVGRIAESCATGFWAGYKSELRPIGVPKRDKMKFLEDAQ